MTQVPAVRMRARRARNVQPRAPRPRGRRPRLSPGMHADAAVATSLPGYRHGHAPRRRLHHPWPWTMMIGDDDRPAGCCSAPRPCLHCRLRRCQCPRGHCKRASEQLQLQCINAIMAMLLDLPAGMPRYICAPRRAGSTQTLCAAAAASLSLHARRTHCGLSRWVLT